MRVFKITLLLVLIYSFHVISAQNTLYVSLSGSHTPPYATLAAGANDIQTAVNAAVAGDLILVDDGSYVLTTEISITKGVTLRSINGNTSVTVDGNNATRCIYINHADAVVDGFTITNGRNLGGFGGGVDIATGGTLQNCIVTNSQARDGGGVAVDTDGLVLNCIIHDNIADTGSGTSGYGGGVRMLNGGITRGCLVYSNTSAGLGGGINIWAAGTIQNCTVINNTGPNGAGIRCRGNAVMENTISYFNNGTNVVTDGSNVTYTNNCTTPALPSGTANIIDDPLFSTTSSNPYQLSSTSTLIDAGVNRAWMTGAADLDGADRLVNGIVDIGAFEYNVIAPSTPTLLSPANYAVGISIEPTLSWNAASGADSYSFVIATDDAFTDVVYSVTGLTATSFDFTSIAFMLDNNTPYYWRVNAANAGGDSDWSETYQLTTVASVIPYLTSPIGGVLLNSITPTLYWYSIPASNNYTYDLFYSITEVTTFVGTTPQKTGFTSLNSALNGLTPGATYYWQVRVRTSAGSIAGYSDVESFITFQQLEAPIQTWPINDALVYTNAPYVYWYSPAYYSLLKYEVRYSTTNAVDSDGMLTDAGGGISLAGLTANHNAHLQTLLPGTDYYWQVRATNDDGTTWSDWSVPEGFTTQGTGTLYVPTLSYPTDDLIIYTTTPTLYWYVYQGATTGLQFEVQYSMDGTQSGGVLQNDLETIALTNSLNVTLPALMPDETYCWQVRSYNGSNYSDWSPVECFVTSASLIEPKTPTISWPLGGSIEYTLNPVLYWYVEGGITTGYQFEVCYSKLNTLDGNGKLNSATTLALTGNTYIRITTNLDAGQVYNWQVRSYKNGTYSEWTTPESFETNAVSSLSAEIPICTWPIGGATVYTKMPELSWYTFTSTATLEYEVLYATDSYTVGGVLQNGTATTAWTTSQNVTLPALMPGATYYWQVRSRVASDHSQMSAYNSVESFVVEAGSSPVALIIGSPTDGVEVESNIPVLSWILPTNSTSSLSYEIEISTNPNMTGANVVSEINGLSYSPANLSSENEYYWRVRSKNENGELSNYSSVGNFKLGSSIMSAEDIEMPTEYSLAQNYPNPFNPTTTLQFSLPEAGYYSIAVYNIIGQKVATLVSGNLSAGTHNVVFDARNFVSGLYFYQLIGNNVNITKKMMLVK